MKDHETLKTHNVKDGLTVHLVIKAPRTPGTQNNQESERSSTTTPSPSIGNFLFLFDNKHFIFHIKNNRKKIKR